MLLVSQVLVTICKINPSPTENTQTSEYVCVCSFMSDFLPPMHRSWPDSSVHGIFQSGILVRLSFPSPRDLPDSGIEPMSLAFYALADGFFTTAPPGKPHMM